MAKFGLIIDFDYLIENLLGSSPSLKLMAVLSGVQEHATGRVRFLVETDHEGLTNHLGWNADPPPGGQIMNMRLCDVLSVIEEEDAADAV